MEDAALVALTLGLVGKLDEILHRFGNSLAEQTYLYLPNVLATDGDVEPNLVSHLWSLLCLKCRDTEQCSKCKYLKREGGVSSI